ncbi:MAG: flagellar biosynthesis protein FlgA [Magnetovibrio sp.]|nr:flagellar biosynthesis protein FlgA [Magnetovibrio sp.]
MNLYSKLQRLNEANSPIRVGMIGAGKFGTMFLAQVRKIPGIHVAGIVELNPETARSNLRYVGWPEEQFNATSFDDAIAHKTTHVSDNWGALIKYSGIEIIIECTGDPIAAVKHCLAAFSEGKHVINVTVEADAFCGAGLSNKAKAANVIYSMAYGDQPALTAELVDWARTSGFSVIAAGRGHKWLPHYRKSTPETVWKHWGINVEQAARCRLNAKMFNAFLDGSKPAIESAAIANATGLNAPKNGLTFPPGSVDDIPTLMRPISEGGVLESKGLVEVISCITTEGKAIPYDLRKGVWVCFEADTQYLKNCFKEYKWVTDPSGKYMSHYKRWHLIGLEFAISIASVSIRNEATGVANFFQADVAAIAKRGLKAGEILDGEGGYTVSGGLRPSKISLAKGYLPLGLAKGVKLKNAVTDGKPLTWNDVTIDETTEAYKLRREMEGIKTALC